MRTYSRATFDEAKASWEGFDWHWQGIRRLAADRGFLFAPTGTAEDDPEAESPSQRSILWQSLDANPKALAVVIGRSRSWSQVIAGITAHRAGLRESADERDQDDAWRRKDEPTGRDATSSLKAILTRIGDS